MDNFINIVLLQHLEELDARNRAKVERRMLRDVSDPFQYTDMDFLKYFRVSKEVARYIIDTLRPHIIQEKSMAVKLEVKVFATIFFCGHGSYQKCVSENFNFAMDQSTFSKVLWEVIDMIIEHLLPTWITFPQTAQEIQQKKQLFHEKFNFPGVVGAIDCTHVAIVAPSTEDPVRPGIAYYNRKGYYSLNVQMICDSEMNILNCNARFPGSVHDSAIWQLSSVRALLQRKYTEGDSGYPLEPWLLTPIENAPADTPEGRYTHAHIRARNTIERCFGILKQKFRCLLKHRVLHYHPVKAAKIVYCCAVLHNISRHDDVLQDGDDDVNEPHANNAVLDANYNLLAAGRRVQRRVVEQYFT